MKMSTGIMLWGCSLLCFALTSILGLGYSLESMTDVGFDDIVGCTTLGLIFGLIALIAGMVRRGIGQRMTELRNYARGSLAIAVVFGILSLISLVLSIHGLTDGTGTKTSDMITSLALLASMAFVAASSLCLIVSAIYDGFYNGRFAIEYERLHGTGRRVNSSSYVSFVTSLDKYMGRAEDIEALVDSSLGRISDHLEDIRRTDPRDYDRIVSMLDGIDWGHMDFLEWNGSTHTVMYRGRR